MVFDAQMLGEFALKFSNFSFLLAFMAPFIGGEMAVLILASLSAQGLFPLWSIIMGGFLGMLSLDSFWFFIPRSPWAKKFKERLSVSEKYQKLEIRLEKFSHHNDIGILLLSKVLIGTRILVLAYLSIRRITYSRFIQYDSIATFCWAIMLGYLGWFAGLGYYNVSRVYENITSVILYIALVAGLLYSLLWYIRKKIIQG